MAAIPIDVIFLKHFIIAHGNGEFKEEDSLLLSSFLPMKGTLLDKVKFLKERGNDFFKQNMFDSAGGCYEMACRLLCVVLDSMGGGDGESVLHLAISLNLNLAACANKLHEYEAAINFSSLVLSSFPKNAKALFRRAVACMKTNMLLEAQTDLETAAMLEPKNKDILRELKVVKDLRAINYNGKRSIDDQLLCEVVRESKRTSCIVDNGNDNGGSLNDNGGSSSGSCSCVTPACVSPSSESFNKDSCNSGAFLPVNLAENSSPNIELDHNHKDSQMGENEQPPKKSVLEFSRKGRGNSHLRISEQAYQKILQGSKVSYYNERDLSFMTIRILNIQTTKEGGITRGHYKRKKRRRRSKKRKLKTAVVSEGTSPSPPSVSLCSSSSSSCVSLSSSSVGENFSPVTVVPSFSSLSNSLENNMAITSKCFQVQRSSNDYEHFTFSAYPKKCKFNSPGKQSRVSTTRRLCRYPSIRQVGGKKDINNSKKKHSQGDESPRHSVSTCSASRSFYRKFLRPRGVSVSCCRYSSGAHLTKKRKEVFAHLESSERPLKKPFRFANPMSSFISFADNVIIKSDSPNRMDTL